jgi:2-dehydro-3-deoxyphosphogluconate aldolase / (4S)-4-hydroxy-2-oxoglutarate aldolase
VDISAIAALAPVVPVLTIERLADAVPLARALVKGGLPVLEITLRTEAALAALAAIAVEVPDAVVGAGTVLQPRQVADVIRSGVRFAVSPGCTPTLVTAVGPQDCHSCRVSRRYRRRWCWLSTVLD